MKNKIKKRKIVKNLCCVLILTLGMILVGCSGNSDTENTTNTIGNTTNTNTTSVNTTISATEIVGSTIQNTSIASVTTDASATAERSSYVLGTIVSVKLYDHGSEEALDILFNALTDIDNKMSVSKADSEISQVNANAGIAPVKVSEDTFKVVQRGLEYYDISQGTFDITLGPLITLWGIGSDHAKVPSQAAIDTALALAGNGDVVLDEGNQTIHLKRSGMAIDLGGIAKGYSADALVEILKQSNVKQAMINLGGNVFTYGTKADGSLWKVGIQSPFEDRNNYVGVVKVANQTVVTSGPYERNFTENGVLYHHILSTTTGFPVTNNLASVSIISGISMDADGFSTTVYALGIEKGLALINSIEGVECILITNDKQIYLSDGMKDNFTISETGYTLAN